MLMNTHSPSLEVLQDTVRLSLPVVIGILKPFLGSHGVRLSPKKYSQIMKQPKDDGELVSNIRHSRVDHTSPLHGPRLIFFF